MQSDARHNLGIVKAAEKRGVCMGCLSTIFETIGLMLELIVDEILDLWCAPLRWIIPENMKSTALQIVLHGLVAGFGVLLLFCILGGLLLCFSDVAEQAALGRKLLWGGLGVYALQSAVGAIVKFRKRSK